MFVVNGGDNKGEVGVFARATRLRLRQKTEDALQVVVSRNKLVVVETYFQLGKELC